MTGRYIVDASVAVKWFVPEVLSDRAEALLRAETELIAPRLIIKEVANAFWKKHRQNLVTSDAALADILSLPRYFRMLADDETYISRAFELAVSHGHPLYDMIYLVAAIENDARVMTADQRFIAKISGTPHSRFMVSLSDWHP